MPRRVKKKVTKDSGHASGRSKLTPWDSDRISVGSASSMDLLMAWLTAPGNGERWRHENPVTICREIITLLKKNGILHREARDVRTQIGLLEKKCASAAAYLSTNDQTDAFQRGEADQEVVTEVLKLCPLYRELVPIFGRLGTEGMMKNVASGVTTAPASSAGDKSDETMSVALATSAATGGSKSAAGKWKESVEKGRFHAQKTIQDGNREKVVEKTVNDADEEQKGDAGDGSKKVEGEKRQSRTVAHGGVEAAIDAVHEIARAAVENKRRDVVADAKNQEKEVAIATTEEKSSGADDKDKTENARKRYRIVVKEVEGGIVADVEGDDDKKSIDDNDGDDLVLEKERKQDNTHPTVSRRLKAKQQQRSKSDDSSSEEIDNEEETRTKKEEQDDDHDDGGEEQIQLAQPDDTTDDDENDEEEEIAELIEVDTDEEEIAELLEVDEEDNEEVKVDEKDKNDVTNTDKFEEEEEEEVEEEPELGGSKAEEASENSSSESESESEDGDNEEEVPPTQLKAASDVEEKSDHDLKHDEGDADADLEEDAQSSATSRQPTRKRSSSDDSFSLSTKRAKETSNAAKALEREAFIDRAKQERDQRDELFQLERAKLVCELQVKQVQLAMEKSLARKKLLGAGIDPVEVDRILPL